MSRMYPKEAFEKAVKAQEKPQPPPRPKINGQPIDGVNAVHYAATIKGIANDIFTRK